MRQRGDGDRLRRTGAVLVAAAVPLIVRPACAQVHADVGSNAGGGVRLRSDTPRPVAAVAGAELHGHVALVPLVRVGGYADFEETLPNGSEGRRYYAVGLDARVASPWTHAPWHTWAFVGIAAEYVVATRRAATSSAAQSVNLGSPSSQVEGVLIEIPVGIGAGLRVHDSYELDAVLSARAALANVGPESRPDPRTDTEPFAGHEVLAVWLSVGVSFGQ